jgi:hypothetical protein
VRLVVSLLTPTPLSVPRIPILYETEHLLVIEKPPGLSHHDKEDGSRGVISLLKDQQALRSPQHHGVDTPPQLYGVHRVSPYKPTAFPHPSSWLTLMQTLTYYSSTKKRRASY